MATCSRLGLFVVFTDAAEEGTDDEDEDDNEDDGAAGQIQAGEKADLKGVWGERPLAFVAGTVDGFNPPVIGARLEPHDAVGLA